MMKGPGSSPDPNFYYRTQFQKTHPVLPRMKAVPGILPTLLEMICFFSTPTIDVEPKKAPFGTCDLHEKDEP